MHFFNRCFNKLQAKIFIAPGNHDPGLPTSPYWSYPWSENVHIFREKIEAVPLSELGCVVYGIGFGHFAIKESLLAGFQVENKNLINIMVFHGEDKSNPLSAGASNYLPFTVAELAQAGADYYALGHHHRPKIVWEDRGIIRACYSGSPEPLGYDEEGDHGLFWGTVGKDRNELRFIKLNERAYRTIHITCNGEEFLDELANLAINQIPEVERMRDFFRLVFNGEIHPKLQFELARLEELLTPGFFNCRVENLTVPRYELREYDIRTARGMFVAKIQSMLSEAAGEEEKELLRQSLYFGLDALNLGKVVER